METEKQTTAKDKAIDKLIETARNLMKEADEERRRKMRAEAKAAILADLVSTPGSGIHYLLPTIFDELDESVDPKIREAIRATNDRHMKACRRLFDYLLEHLL